jgi:hypothetical protein
MAVVWNWPLKATTDVCKLNTDIRVVSKTASRLQATVTNSFRSKHVLTQVLGDGTTPRD